MKERKTDTLVRREIRGERAGSTSKIYDFRELQLHWPAHGYPREAPQITRGLILLHRLPGEQ